MSVEFDEPVKLLRIPFKVNHELCRKINHDYEVRRVEVQYALTFEKHANVIVSALRAMGFFVSKIEVNGDYVLNVSVIFHPEISTKIIVGTQKLIIATIEMLAENENLF